MAAEALHAREETPAKLSRSRRAFSTIEILVAVAIIAILAGATVPAIRTRLSVGDADAIVAEVENLEKALQAFQDNTITYPQTLAQLSQLSSTTTSCGTAMSAAQISRWRGPYVTRPITASYTVTADVTLENTLVRDTTPGVGLLDIKLDNVEQDVANQVERQIDGAINGSSSTTGAVLWTTSSGTLVNLTFRFPVRGC